MDSLKYGEGMCRIVEMSVEMSHNSRISTEFSRENRICDEKASTGSAVPVDNFQGMQGTEQQIHPQHGITLWMNPPGGWKKAKKPRPKGLGLWGG